MQTMQLMQQNLAQGLPITALQSVLSTLQAQYALQKQEEEKIKNAPQPSASQLAEQQAKLAQDLEEQRKQKEAQAEILKQQQLQQQLAEQQAKVAQDLEEQRKQQEAQEEILKQQQQAEQQPKQQEAEEEDKQNQKQQLPPGTEGDAAVGKLAASVGVWCYSVWETHQDVTL